MMSTYDEEGYDIPEDPELKQRQESDEYDPNEVLKQTGRLQSRMVDAIGKQKIDDLVGDPKLLEATSAFLNGVNNTAVQTIRNGIVEKHTDVGAIADEVMKRMRHSGQSNIRRSEGNERGRIPRNVEIPMDDKEANIEKSMLQRGLIDQNFDQFAEAHDIPTGTTED